MPAPRRMSNAPSSDWRSRCRNSDRSGNLPRPRSSRSSLADAKAQVGLLPEQEDDDALLLRLISTGRRLVEQRLGVTLATRQFRATFEPANLGHCHGHDHYHQDYTYYQGSRRLRAAGSRCRPSWSTGHTR
jgi:hypothetical protein